MNSELLANAWEISIFWFLLITVSLIGTAMIIMAIIEVAEWLRKTRWFKKHFTTYGGR